MWECGDERAILLDDDSLTGEYYTCVCVCVYKTYAGIPGYMQLNEIVVQISQLPEIYGFSSL